MTARIHKFPNFFRPAIPRDEPCVIVVLPVVRIERECRKIVELRRQSKRLREYFKPRVSGGSDHG